MTSQRNDGEGSGSFEGDPLTGAACVGVIVGLPMVIGYLAGVGGWSWHGSVVLLVLVLVVPALAYAFKLEKVLGLVTSSVRAFFAWASERALGFAALFGALVLTFAAARFSPAVALVVAVVVAAVLSAIVAREIAMRKTTDQIARDPDRFDSPGSDRVRYAAEAEEDGDAVVFVGLDEVNEPNELEAGGVGEVRATSPSNSAETS